MMQVKMMLSAVALVLTGSAFLSGPETPRPGTPGPPGVSGTESPRWLALGDSYTAAEAVIPAQGYPAQVQRMLADRDQLSCAAPEIIARTGWTTADLLDALEAVRPASGYQMVSLLIGVNNQYQGLSQTLYRKQFSLLLEQAIRLAGDRPSHVLVLSIPDYSVTPFGRRRDSAVIAVQIDSLNAINAALAREWRVHYVDVTEESRRVAVDPELVAADGLHYSGKEYAAWARLMEPVLREIWQ
jgi:lysophospholipase L1-like esterase